jgi:hypothetical protein
MSRIGQSAQLLTAVNESGEGMKRVIFLVLAWSAAGTALAQNSDALRALLDKHLTLFSGEQSKQIAEETIGTPALFQDLALLTPTDTEALFGALFENIKSRGWARSVALNVDVCELGQGLALLALNYSRLQDDGEAIPPRVRGELYLLRELDTGWRIVAVFGRDPDITVSCN